MTPSIYLKRPLVICLVALISFLSLDAQEPSSALSKLELNKLNQLETEFNLELLHIDESNWATPMRKPVSYTHLTLPTIYSV